MSEVGRITPEDFEVLDAASCAASHFEFLLRKCRMSPTQRNVLEQALVIVTRIAAEITADCLSDTLSEEERAEVANEIACAWQDLLCILSLSLSRYLTEQRRQALEAAQVTLERLFKENKPKNHQNELAEFEKLIGRINADLEA